MSNTSNLVLPYLAVGQAQKHVTVNETLRKLDAIVQLSVISATTAAEPSSPTDGAVYIVPAGKSGAHWSAFANWSLGYYRDGAWVQISPCEGWLAFVRDTGQLLAWTGSAWSLFPAAKILAVSATDRILGRSSSGAGAAEEITCTAAGRALIDDADAAAQRATLGAAGVSVANSFASGQRIGPDGSTAALLTLGSTVDDGFIRFFNAGALAYVGFIYGGGDNRFAIGNAQATGDLSLWARGNQRVRISDTTLTFNVTPLPETDNLYNLGSGSFRMATLYAATGVINTSDAREKTPLRPLADAERRAIRRIMGGAGVFQWLDAASTKGAEARLHVGVTAQAVADAFRAEGLEPERYALFCADPVEEDVDVEETVRVKRPVAGAEREVVELVDGRPVLKRVVEPLKRLEAVVDELGEPVLRGGKPLTHEVDVTEEVEIARTVRIRRPVLDDSGQQVVRLGVRYDQLFAMALAALMAPGD